MSDIFHVRTMSADLKEEQVSKQVQVMNQMRNVATTNNVGGADPLRRLSTFLRTAFKDENDTEDRFAHMFGEWTQNYFVTYAALNSKIHEVISDALMFKFNTSQMRILNCTSLLLYQGLNVLNQGNDTKNERYLSFMRKLKSNTYTRHSYVFTFPINDKGTGLDPKAAKISESCTLVKTAQQAEGNLLAFYANLKKNGDHPVLLFQKELEKGEMAQAGITKPVHFVLDGTLPLLLQRPEEITTAEHFEVDGVPSCFWDVVFIISMTRAKFQELGPALDTMGLLDIVDDGQGELVITCSAFLCYLSFMLRMTTYITCAQPILEELKEPKFHSLPHCEYVTTKKDVRGLLKRQEEALATLREQDSEE